MNRRLFDFDYLNQLPGEYPIDTPPHVWNFLPPENSWLRP